MACGSLSLLRGPRPEPRLGKSSGKKVNEERSSQRREGGAGLRARRHPGTRCTGAAAPGRGVAQISWHGADGSAAGRRRRGDADRGAGRPEARAAAAVLGRGAQSAHRRAGVSAGVRPRAVGQTSAAAAALRADGARITRGRAALVGGQATRASAFSRRGAARAGAALVVFHAKLPRHATERGGIARALRAAADAFGARVARPRATLHARRAALLLRLTAGDARAASRAAGAGRNQAAARAAVLVVHAQRGRHAAARQRLAAQSPARGGGAATAAARVARRARLAVDAAAVEEQARRRAAFVAARAAAPTALVGLHARLAGRAAVRQLLAQAHHAGAAAAVGRRRASRAGGGAGGAAAHPVRAAE